LARHRSWGLIAALAAGAAAPAFADTYVAGNRAFIPTLLTDDPFVADELTGTATRITNLAGGGSPAVRETDFGWAFSKRITPDLAVEIEQGYTVLSPAGLRRVYGFDNVEATLKYQLYVNPEHEFLLSAGISHEFGGSGAARVADTIGATSPTLFFGKGFGDLPDGLAWLRPLAVTGVLEYEIPDRRTADTPTTLTGGMAIEYNLRYLEGNVAYLGLPEFIDRMTPVVEFQFSAPTSRAPGTPITGTVAPGIVYSGNTFDIGVEALIPATRGTRTSIGAIAMLHLRLEALFPTTLGRPLFGAEK